MSGRIGCAFAVAFLLAVAAPGVPSKPGSEPRGGNGAPLPIGLAAAVSSTLGREQQHFAAARSDGRLVARGGGLATVFGSSGPIVQTRRGQLALQLTGVGRGGRLAMAGAAMPVARGNEVSYRRGSLVEWYRNGPLGLEQGFTLEQRPPGHGRLTLAVRASGSLAPRRLGGELRFGANQVTYGGVSALDAAGRPLEATLELSRRTLLLRVDDGRARYPLTIDPFIQQGEKLTGGGEAGNGSFGLSVALSADGTTALIGGYSDDGGKGAAWIFSRSGGAWTQQGSKLTASGETGNGSFGSSVALSADGDTAVIGGPGDDTLKGAAWVFSRSGAAWNQQGGKLTGGGEIGNGRFGGSVALSANGNTAVIGAYGDDTFKGAAWVFSRSGTAWNQQGGKLTGSGSFGDSVALSADGDTALIGAPGDDGGKGAAWVFSRSGTAWNQQGGKLTGSGETGNGRFGGSVALAANGTSALIGGPTDDTFKGAAWVFTRSGTAWAQQGGKLTGGGETGDGRFGGSVALSVNADTALIGGYSDDGYNGAAWVFGRSGAAWSQQGGKLTGGETGNGYFGVSVALSADGDTALIGGPVDGTKGAAWAFSSAAPSVSGLSPSSGPTTGGTLVTITGSNLTGATAVKFGSAAATLAKVVSDSEISAVAPPGQAGRVDVTVTGPTGTSATNSNAKFTYTGPATTTLTVAANPIVARIVYATVLRKGTTRTLDIRIRVSTKAKATVRLLRTKTQKLQKTFAVRSGANELKAPLPRRLGRGTYQVKITLADTAAHQRTYATTVLVPA